MRQALADPKRPVDGGHPSSDSERFVAGTFERISFSNCREAGLGSDGCMV